MALTTVSSGNTAQANDLNQVINILQQPSGGQEKGKYWIESNGEASGSYGIDYYNSLNRNAVPVGVSIDEADAGHNTCNAASSANLTAFGVKITTTSTAQTIHFFVAGNITLQF